VLLRVVADGVLVAAENVDGVAADAQPRAGNAAFINRIADGGVRRARAFGAHVALGGEAGHQVVAGRESCRDGALRHRFLHGLKIFRAGMKKKMDVGIDQTGKKCAIAQIDDFGASRTLDCSPDFDDAFALHQDLPWLEHAPGLDIEQARRVQHDWMGRGVLRLGSGALTKRQRQHQREGCRKRASAWHMGRDLTTWNRAKPDRCDGPGA
jgi:hypothetical protein